MNRKTQPEQPSANDDPFVWKPRAEPAATPRDRVKLILMCGLYMVWIGFLIWMATR